MKYPSNPRPQDAAFILGGAVHVQFLRRLSAKAALFAMLWFLTGLTVSATTYYIDYGSGSDSNSGTSKSSPWKRHPFMQGFAGSYRHTGGDSFIFRGGVTWPVSCFQLTITAGGVSDSNRDYYGTDPTWYAGSSFTRALFDFQNSQIASGFAGSGVHITASYINFGDGLDLARHRADVVYGGMTISGYGNVSYLKLTNCVVRDWSLSSPVASGQDGGGGIGYFGGGGGAALEVDHCTFHQVNSATINGTAVVNIGTCKFSEIYHTASALHGAGNIHDNSIHDLLDTSDAAQHTDAIITYSQSTIYNNLIYNLVGRCAPIELSAPSVSAVTGYDTVYNNIVYNPGAQPNLWTKVDNGNYAIYGLVAYNNLFEHGSSYCLIIEGGYAGAVFGTLNTHDNVFITTGPGIVYGGNYHSANVTSVSSVNDKVVGSLAGYSASNNYNPGGIRGPVGSFGAWGVGTASPNTPITVGLTSPGSGATVSGTITLSASATPGSSGSAISSVRFVVDGTQVGSATSSGSSFSYSWDSHGVADGTHGIVAIAIDSSGVQASSSSVSVSVANGAASSSATTLIWSAGSGTITAPFAVTTSGSTVYISQPVATGSSTGGRATYGFDTTALGTYSVSATFDAPDQDHNSFYVTMETDGTITEANVWDVPITSGSWQTSTVSWRGTGSNTSPQIPVKTWNLAAGHHTLTITGREAGAMLQQISVVPVSSSSVGALGVSVTSPTSGSIVAGTITLNATAVPGSSGVLKAVQFLVDGAQVGSVNSTSGNYSFTWNSSSAAEGSHSISAIVTDSNGATANSASIPVTVANATWLPNEGTITGPFLITTNASVVYVTQNVATGPTDGGKATYSFTTSSAGTYSVEATINTSDQDHNSFYVTMETDGTPTEANVWDMPVTGGVWQTVPTSWRGTGSNTAPQYPVKTWSVNAGSHTLTFVGREASAKLGNIAVIKTPTPPGNLRIVAQ